MFTANMVAGMICHIDIGQISCTVGSMPTTLAAAAPPTTRPPAPTGGLFGEADLSQDRLFRRNRRFLIAAAASMLSGLAIDLWAEGRTWGTIGDAISLMGLALGAPMFLIAARTVLFRRAKLTTEVFITIALIAVVYEQHYWYASWVVFILWLGETLMAWAGRHARSAVEALLRLVPRQARVLTADGAEMVPIEQVAVGQLVAANPDERIPVDGVIERGETAVDESMLTGESVPADRGLGDQVFAGTANLQGAIAIRVTAAAEDNAVARIVTLMRQAQNAHVPAKRTVDLFLRWFLPLVLVAAAAAGVLTGSLDRVASILLVITPCAFTASTPLALIATVGNAARRGVIMKGGSGIEASSRSQVVLLDKTGTLTTSTPQLITVDAFRGSERDVLRLAAIAEKPSTHPLARAIGVAAAGRDLDVPDPQDFEVASGHGVLAVHAGRRLAVGNERFLRRRGIVAAPAVRDRAVLREEEGYTIAYVVEGDVVIGLLGFLAQPRDSAAEVIGGLRKLGVEHIVMVTGDASKPAEAVAGQLGIDYRAQATPEDKLEEVQRWKREGKVVTMVGDGINDSTALAAADAGVAMVTPGAEVAAFAADIVVHGDRLSRVLAAARLCRRGIRTIQVNIAFATGYNIIGLILALFGLISPGTAALFHAASFISVALNSALVLTYDPKVPDDAEPVRAREPRELAAAA
jgi:heavy metal translocating P-type ATPase